MFQGFLCYNLPKDIVLNMANNFRKSGGGVLNIRQKLLGMIALLITVPLLIMGGASYMKASSLLMENFVESSELLNQEIAAEIDKEFSGYLYGIQSLAGNYNAKMLLEDDLKEQNLMNAIQLYVENYPSAFQAYIGLKDKSMRIYPKHMFDSSYDPRVRPWYTLAQSENTSGWTGIYQDAVTGNWSVSGTAPVIDFNGKFIGAVATSLDLSSVSETIASKKIGRSGYAFLVDHLGTVIGHPNVDNVGTQIPIPEIQAALEAGTESGYVDYSVETDSGMVEKFAVYEYIPSMKWYIFTTINHNEISDSTGALINWAAIIGGVTLLIAAFITLTFSNSLTKPIQRLVKNMGQVEAGDMTVQASIKRSDELGTLANSFNNMVTNVRGLIDNSSKVTLEVSDASQNLAGSAEEVSASSEEVTQTIEEIAKGASEQAIDAQNAVTLAGQLDSKFAELSSSSSSIALGASSAQEYNEKGTNVLRDLKEKSDQNNASTHRIADAIEELEQKSKDIGSILETITSIADQTNLLALNASIEAARAGEHGRGFAVVAEEIRKLAEESGSSAEQIGKIVGMIQEQTGNTVKIMDEFKGNASAQYEAVEEMDKSFTEISSSVDVVSKQIEEIDAYITEMISDKDAIVEAISNISSVSEETAAASEEVSASMEQQNAAIETVASSAEHLNELSIQLSEEIMKFKI
jgi:methyl-accepting chemotaxis protein